MLVSSGQTWACFTRVSIGNNQLARDGPGRETKERLWMKTLDPLDLEILSQPRGFALLADGKPMTTSGGTLVEHEAVALLNQMQSEFLQHPVLEVDGGRIVEPRFLGSYSLFGIQKDWVEAGRDNLTEDFEVALLQDPCLSPLPGPERIHQHARYSPLLQ